MDYFTISISILLSCSILMETLGVWARVIGTKLKEPTVGYSTHVRLGTLGRFCTLIAAPILGYKVDQNIASSTIATIGATTFIIVAISIYIFTTLRKNIIVYAYTILNKRSLENIDLLHCKPNLPKKINTRFSLLVIFSFGFTAIGLILVNFLATQLPDFRATIVQMSALITALGTLIHIFFVDTKLSKAADTDPAVLTDLASTFLYSRFVMSIVLFFAFFNLRFIS